MCENTCINLNILCLAKKKTSILKYGMDEKTVAVNVFFIFIFHVIKIIVLFRMHFASNHSYSVHDTIWNVLLFFDGCSCLFVHLMRLSIFRYHIPAPVEQSLSLALGFPSQLLTLFQIHLPLYLHQICNANDNSRWNRDHVCVCVCLR